MGLTTWQRSGQNDRSSARFATPKRRTTATVLLAVIAFLLMSVTFAQPESAQSESYLRIVRTRNAQDEPWLAETGSDFGRTTALAVIPIQTPPDAGTVRIEMTVTMDFKTGPNDWGVVHGLIHKEDSGRTIRMSPGSFRLVSPRSNKRTTTTLMWAAKSVPAEGREYEIELSASARHPRDENRSRFTGRRFTVVVEVWR